MNPEWAEPAQACDRNSGCSQGVERIKGMEAVKPGCGSFRIRKNNPQAATSSGTGACGVYVAGL